MSALKQHNESVHEKNEPFNCDICESSFTLESALKQHLSIHEKKEPVEENLLYGCKKCPQKFGDVLLAQSHFLKDHQGIEDFEDIEDQIDMIEYGKTSYNCPVCKKLYKRRKTLVNHMRKKHEHNNNISASDSIAPDNNEIPLKRKAKSGNYKVVPGKTKNSKLYIFEGFAYRKNKARNDIIYLCCQEKEFENKCLAKAEIDCVEDTMVRTANHNHLTKEHTLLVNELRHKLLDGAEVLDGKPLHKIYVDITLNDPVAWAISYIDIEPGMRKRREKKYPKIPKNIMEVDELMKVADPGLRKNYKGLLKDEGKLQFTKITILIYYTYFLYELIGKTFGHNICNRMVFFLIWVLLCIFALWENLWSQYLQSYGFSPV